MVLDFKLVWSLFKVDQGFISTAFLIGSLLFSKVSSGVNTPFVEWERWNHRATAPEERVGLQAGMSSPAYADVAFSWPEAAWSRFLPFQQCGDYGLAQESSFANGFAC